MTKIPEGKSALYVHVSSLAHQCLKSYCAAKKFTMTQVVEAMIQKLVMEELRGMDREKT